MTLLGDLPDDLGAGGFSQAADLLAGIFADPGPCVQRNTYEDSFLETNGQFVPVMIE